MGVDKLVVVVHRCQCMRACQLRCQYMRPCQLRCRVGGANSYSAHACAACSLYAKGRIFKLNTLRGHCVY